MSPFALRRLSDERLGSRLADGEAAAFDELFRRYVHLLAAYGAHLLGDAASGDDVAQAALLKAYAALRRGPTPERLRPWLYRIAHNVALDQLARRRDLLLDRLPDRPAPASSPLGGALVAALASLPERQRRVYVLRELHGLRIDETAAELALTPQQVEQALFAARNRMAEHIVFGDRLDCVTVRRLAAGALDATEGRALKTHLRSCPSCRHELGARGRGLVVAPFGLVEWLRGALVGGGMPVAAKVTAAVATAGLAVGLPGAAERLPGPDPHPFRPVPQAVARLPKVVAQRPTRHVEIATPLVAKPVERRPELRHPGGAVSSAPDGRSDRRGADDGGTTAVVDRRSGSSDGETSDHSGDGGSDSGSGSSSDGPG